MSEGPSGVAVGEEDPIQAMDMDTVRTATVEGRENGKVMINGVDITNPNWNFTWDEWNKLQGNYDYIFERRNPMHDCNND